MNNLTPPGEEVLKKIGINPSEFCRRISSEKDLQYVTVISLLTIHSPDPEAENIKQIEGFLEAFEHLCSIDDWDRAWKLISIPLNTPTNEELREQLNTWGYALRQLEIHQKLLNKLPEENSLVLLGIGEAYNSLGDYQQSLNSFKTALQETTNSEETATILEGLGSSYLLQNEYDLAISYYEKALANTPRNNNKERQRNILENLGKAYFFGKRDYEKSFDCLNKSLALARYLQNYRGEGVVLKHLGDCYLTWQDYHKAEECYQQSLAIMQKIENRQGQEVALLGIGRIHLSFQEYDEAINCFEEALYIAQKIDDRRGEGEAFGNLGMACHQKGNREQAFNYYNLGLNIAQEINNRQAERTSLAFLAMMYLEQEEYDSAIEYHEKAILIAREMGDLNWVGVNLAYLSNAYLAIGKTDKALEYCEESSAIAEQTKNPSVEIMALNGMLKIHNLLGNSFQVAELSLKLTAALAKNSVSNAWQRFTKSGELNL